MIHVNNLSSFDTVHKYNVKKTLTCNEKGKDRIKKSPIEFIIFYDELKNEVYT